MSQYYNSQRVRGLYNSQAEDPFKISRSKIDLFVECPRCFYYDRKLGVSRPPSFPFSLNSAVDALLKKEFDIHRAKRTKHPLMHAYGVDAVPFDDPRLEEWRDSLRRGIIYHHKPTNFLISGGVDDVWINPKGELIIVDYKATAKDGKVGLDAEWQDVYKRQMEIYQWLFRKNDFRVSSVGYFVYCNGQTDREAFDGKLEFDITLLPYEGDTGWLEETIQKIYESLNQNNIPDAGSDCDYCAYMDSVGKYH